MRDGDLELRRFRPSDAEALEALFAEPEVKRWWVDSDYDRDNGWVVEVGGELAGWVQYVEEPYEWYPSVALDIALTTALHGRGYGRRALRLAIEHFVAKGHHRFTIDPDVDNERAIRSYAAVGFEPVGVLRSYERNPEGGWKDGLLMDLIVLDRESGTGVRDVLKHRGDGESITDRECREVLLLAEREDISITRSRYGPGERGPDAHVHREHTDAFFVLEGELTFALGPEAERVRVPAGGFVAVPPNLVHSFVNEANADTRFLNFHAPDKGFAAYMRARRDGGDATFDSFDPPADGGLPATGAIVAGPGEGEVLVSGNRVVLLKGDLPDLCFAEFALDGPFDGPDVHQHDAQVDSFYVLEGELDMTVEGSVHQAGPGTLASVPRRVQHTFAHTKGGKARFLNIHAPNGGFADFLRRISN